MKYLNVTVECYKSVLESEGSLISVNGPFDTITMNEENGGYSIGDFAIVTHVNMLGTNKTENKLNSTLEKREPLEITVRLTRCDKDIEKQIGTDLDRFIIDTNSEENRKNVHVACFPYFNFKRITQVKNVELPLGSGVYVIKVMVRELSSDTPTIQAMTYLSIAGTDNEE